MHKSEIDFPKTVSKLQQTLVVYFFYSNVDYYQSLIIKREIFLNTPDTWTF